MAGTLTINIGKYRVRHGLPAQIDVSDPDSLRRAFEQIAEVIRTLNGEGKDINLSIVTKGELMEKENKLRAWMDRVEARLTALEP